MAYLLPKTRYGEWVCQILIKMGDAEWYVPREQTNRRSGLDTKIADWGFKKFSNFVDAGVGRCFAWLETKRLDQIRKQKRLPLR